MSQSKCSFARVRFLCCTCLIACIACPVGAQVNPSAGSQVQEETSGGTERPQRRRRGPLPDWAKESWFIRRQMDARLCLRNVNVIDVRTGTVRSNVNIVIRGDVIRSVGSEPLPDDARVVDGTGHYVIPGLFDLHAHVMPKWKIFPTSKEPEETLKLLLDSGVTTIRAIPLYSESALLWSARVNAGQLPGPTIIATSSVFEKEPQRTSRGFGDSETVRQWIHKEALLGCRWIKVYDQMDEESLDAIVKAAAEFGMRVCGHASLVPPHRAAELGISTVEHLIGIAYSGVPDGVVAPADLVGLANAVWYWRHVDVGKCRALMDVFKKNGTGWVPTLVVAEKIVRVGAHHFQSISKDDAKQLETAIRISAKLAVDLHRMGGLVGIGTDFPVDGVEPGVSVHRELELLVELGGATPLEALQMATLSSARILGFESLLGSIEDGKIANLVVLSANPLEDISNTRKITHVIHDGRLHEIKP